MDKFEAKLAKATSLEDGDLLGAFAIVVDSQAGRQFLDDNSPPLDPDCTVSLASAGKFFTNVAALQLVERGILTLDEPINKYIPEIDKCLLVEQVYNPEDVDKAGQETDNGGANNIWKKIVLRKPVRHVTLRHLLISTSGIGTCDSYQARFGSDDVVPPLDFPQDSNFLIKHRSTHLFFEPGEGFDYGWSIYYVQLLIERLGGKDRYTQYADEYIFKPLGMTSSTYNPDRVPDVWVRRLQMVERVKGTKDEGPRFEIRDEVTRGLTCSLSDIARFFGDLLSPDCKLLRLQSHRDMLFMPQLDPGSPAHQSLQAEVENYGFLLPFKDGVPLKDSVTLSPPPAVNWTVAGTLIEEDDALPGTGLPKGTVAFEGLPNIIWTMNREKGIMVLGGSQLLPDWDRKAHNLITEFIYEAWEVFA